MRFYLFSFNNSHIIEIFMNAKSLNPNRQSFKKWTFKYFFVGIDRELLLNVNRLESLIFFQATSKSGAKLQKTWKKFLDFLDFVWFSFYQVVKRYKNSLCGRMKSKLECKIGQKDTLEQYNFRIFRADYDGIRYFLPIHIFSSVRGSLIVDKDLWCTTSDVQIALCISIL